jgi:hypothetical protein
MPLQSLKSKLDNDRIGVSIVPEYLGTCEEGRIWMYFSARGAWEREYLKCPTLT